MDVEIGKKGNTRAMRSLLYKKDKDMVLCDSSMTISQTPLPHNNLVKRIGNILKLNSLNGNNFLHSKKW